MRFRKRALFRSLILPVPTLFLKVEPCEGNGKVDHEKGMQDDGSDHGITASYHDSDEDEDQQDPDEDQEHVKPHSAPENEKGDDRPPEDQWNDESDDHPGHRCPPGEVGVRSLYYS